MFELFKGIVTPKDWMAVGAIIGVLVIIIALYVFVLHAGQLNELEEVTDQNTLKKADLQFALETQENIKDLKKEMTKIQNLVTIFEERLPEKSEIPRLVRQFELLGNEVGVVPDLTSRQPQKSGNKETIPYDIVVYGDFHQIVSFINRLERFERYIKISELTLSEEKERVCEAKFTLSTYRFIQTTSGGAS